MNLQNRNRLTDFKNELMVQGEVWWESIIKEFVMGL